MFAVETIAKGELLAVWGGTVVTRQTLETLSEGEQRLSVQVEDDLYLITIVEGPADYINHCCQPNAGMYGQMGVVAMREIARDEEVCYDYAMSDGSDYDEFECTCGADSCRKQVRGDDWSNPQLWERYEGYFSPYLQRRIERLRQESTSQV